MPQDAQPAASPNAPSTAIAVLSIGGTDPTGGAGVYGDVRTITAHGAYGAAVVTAITAQNHLGVTAVAEVPADLVTAQIEAVLAQGAPRAVKTGMLYSPETARAVGKAIGSIRAPRVVDPVLTASAGGSLSRPGLAAALQETVFPGAALVTPNLFEAAQFLGRDVAPGEEAEAAATLRRMWGIDAVLLKGGHGSGSLATDWLARGDGVHAISLPRITSSHGHGSGCALASSIAVRLSRGEDIVRAVSGAKTYLHRALGAARALGTGRGPVKHEVPADVPGSGPVVSLALGPS